MCDPQIISKLYVSVLHEDILKFHLSNADIRTGIQNMKEVYMPDPLSLSNAVLSVANYDDPAHRCAYLHKYAPFHTALVADMLERAILENPKVFGDTIFNSGVFNICSLGGGPGSDVIGAMSALNSNFGFFQVSATVVDCMTNWRQTFGSVIQELRYGSYGSLGECVSDQYFTWDYIGSNLLAKMTNEVHKAVATANLVTMIKFVSASACKDTTEMIKKIFRTMKPGALVLYIDNAGGGFHHMVRKEAQECNLITVFGPLKHEHYTTNDFNEKRFGYTPCLETKVSVHIWRKPSTSQPQRSQSADPHLQPIHNINQPYVDVNSWQNIVNNHFMGLRVQPDVHHQNVTVNQPAGFNNRGGNNRGGNRGGNNRRGRSRSRGRSPRRGPRRQNENNYNRMADESGNTSEDEEEEPQCCCVIS